MGGSAHDEWDITCFYPLPWSVFAWMIMNLSNAFVFFFGMFMMYLTWTRIDKINTLIKTMCTSIILLFIAAEVQWIIHVTSSVICDADNGNIFGFEIWLDLGLVALLFYQLGLAVLYLVFVSRLNKAFKGTPLALSSAGFIFFVLGFFLQVGFACMVMFFFYAFPPQKWYYALDMIVCFGVTNSFFALILLTVFFRKILRLSDATLLKAAIRLVLCASLGLLSTNFASIMSFVRAVEDGEIQWTTHVMFKSLDCAVNLFSLYLQFPFGLKMFEITCGKLANKWEKSISKTHEIRLEMSMNATNTENVGQSVNSAPTKTNSDSPQQLSVSADPSHQTNTVSADFVLH